MRKYTVHRSYSCGKGAFWIAFFLWSRVSSFLFFFFFFLLRAAARAANISPSLLQFIHALSPAVIHQKRINAGAVRLHSGLGSVRPSSLSLAGHRAE